MLDQLADTGRIGYVASAAEVVDALRSGGVGDCTPWTPIRNPVGGARERGTCRIGWSELAIGVYPGGDAARRQFATEAGLAGAVSPPVEIHVATGANWTVGGGDGVLVELAADVLGGAYQRYP